MAEQWLNEIYDKAILIEYLNKIVDLLHKNQIRLAMRLWSEKASPLIRDVCHNDNSAAKLAAVALRTAEKYEDFPSFAGMIEGRLIPSVYDYISQFCGIDVTEGGYRLHSSDSGFLTMADKNGMQHMHSTHDPMWEAHILANEIFDPSIGKYAVYGCGLGYLPFQLYQMSDSSVKITVYEYNPQIIEYAFSYGVLEWIAPSDLKIVCNNEEELIGLFLQNDQDKATVSCISPWFDKEFHLKSGSKMLEYMINGRPEVNYRVIWGINYRKNRELSLRSAESFSFNTDLHAYKECIVIAAGPSLDYCIPFLKDSKGKRILIAVDVVLRRLLNEDIKPDAVVAIDPFDQMRDCIEGIGDKVTDIPLFMTRLTNWFYSYEYQGPRYVFQNPGSMASVGFVESDGPFWDHSPTVAGAALEAGFFFGFNRIYMVGVDLGYPEGKQFAEGMIHESVKNIDNETKGVSVDGGRVITTNTFLACRNGIERQIKSHPEINVVNMSKHGLLIEGAKKFED